MLRASTWFVIILVAFASNSVRAQGVAPATLPAVHPPGRPHNPNIESWRVVIYADRNEPSSQGREEFWSAAYHNLEKFLRDRQFQVTIREDDGRLDIPLTDMVAQLGLLSDGQHGSKSRTWEFYEWQFDLMAPAFRSIDFAMDGGERFTLDAENSRMVPRDEAEVGTQVISYNWNVNVKAAPMLPIATAELTATVHPAAPGAGSLTRRVVVTRMPSERLQNLVRIRLFDITITDETTRTRFLDIFRQQTDTSLTRAMVGDSGQPPILFVPYSLIPVPVVTEWRTLAFGSSERVGRLWAAQVVEMRESPGSPARYDLMAGAQWTDCLPVERQEYETLKKARATADEQFFWKVTLPLSLNASEPQANPPVVFIGRSGRGQASAWVYDRVTGVTPLEAPTWLERELPRVEEGQPK